MRGSPEFSSRELAIKTRIGRENMNSRRFSASSIREDTNSFRSNITISSSTVSSPGYTTREEIDPSTYSFTTALKALQAKARLVDNWEIKGVALNSKWNEAEKYISNPLSGQVPMECLSSKTLSARITMSAPLIYPSRSPLIQTTPYSIPTHEDVLCIPIKVAEKKAENMTRDVGVQSTPAELTSPPMEQDSIKCSAKKSDSPKLKYETEGIVKIQLGYGTNRSNQYGIECTEAELGVWTTPD
ncbi:hypothetical protein LguiA_005871 [Lonicera macranthoides]